MIPILLGHLWTSWMLWTTPSWCTANRKTRTWEPALSRLRQITTGISIRTSSESHCIAASSTGRIRCRTSRSGRAATMTTAHCAPCEALAPTKCGKMGSTALSTTAGMPPMRYRGLSTGRGWLSVVRNNQPSYVQELASCSAWEAWSRRLVMHRRWWVVWCSLENCEMHLHWT